MAKARMSAGLLASILVLGSTASAKAAPTVAQMLSFRPKQEGVTYTTPTPQEQDRCKVELVKAGRTTGWLLKDERGDSLRRYLDTNADNKIDIWSYYHKGVEVYREIDSTFNDRVDQYRWLHAAGSKWGLDPTEDGKIKSWRALCPEELSQEVLQAVIKRDYSRLQALMITEAEIKALELPTGEANRIRDSLRKAPAKFQETYGKLGVMDKARWDHLELATPQCVPADASGAKQDILRYTNGTVVYQVVDKDSARADGLQIGELIQVGQAWRLIEAPAPGLGSSSTDPEAGKPVTSKELESLLKDLQKHDESQPKLDSSAPAQLAAWNLKRADILEKMVALKDARPEDREQWHRQVADCLSVAAQSSKDDKAAYHRLVALRDKLVKEDASSGVAAYFVYAEIMAIYSIDLTEGKKDGPKVQKDLLEKLAKYIQDFPKADNSPDALLQLGMISELMNEEAQAKKWYDMFVKNFPNHPQMPKIAGAIRRLDLDGKVLDLAGPTLAGSPADIKNHKGKLVVVYYWASWNAQCAGDLEKLKDLHGKYSAKGLEVMCVNLDDTAAAAKAYLQGKQAPTTHLFDEGGMTSKFGTQYGIMVLPTMFVVGKDGKVSSRSVQLSGLEDEIKKALN